MPDGNMSPAIICLIFSCSYFASVHARINPPDFDSGWLTIQAADHKKVSLARKSISHGLGETPLLVDVQVKAIDGPNKDYVFQAVGHQIRDDDYAEDFGNVVYVYDSKSVIVSAPVKENGYQGKAICIAKASAWVGRNQDYYGNSALFRVRAWRESSLPPADFVSKSNVLTAATDDNESSAGISPCNANVFCTKTVGIFTCQCKSGYTGNGQTCTDINECSSDISPCNVNANCTNTAGSFTCQCSSGYTGNGQTCTDVNECSAGISPCNVNANCTNTAGSFTCHCKSGYTGNGQTCTAQPEGNKLVIFIAAPVSIVVLLVFVLTVTVFIFRRKPNQNEDVQQLTNENTANATNDDNDYDLVDIFGDSYYNYHAVYRTDENDQNQYTFGQAGGGDPCYSNVDRNDTDSAIHNDDSSYVNL